MSALHAVGILGAGFVAGAINAVVGSGTLITFPVLLAFGYSPVVANVSNCVGLVPGSAAGAVGYRRELSGQRARMLRLGTVSVVGGTTGAVLLLVLPASAFKHVVVVFIALALVLIVLQPLISRWVIAASRAGRRREQAGPIGTAAVLGSGVYGGYFGAAQGIILLAILGVSIDDDLQRINALKVVLAGLVNLVAGVIFVFAADVAWAPAVLIAVGSTVGGYLGAHGARRLPAWGLRLVILGVGISAIVHLLD
ncbi:MAG: sulfite exporter TauE/SafE family protein [Solirubrobacteraceae bacterium]